MPDIVEKCDVCGALLDEEDLFCGNCGRSVGGRDSAGPGPAYTSTYNFECASCGATMSYDASARALRCPFCGAERLEARRDCRVLTPSRVAPFTITESQAVEQTRKWLGSGLWRPGDLAKLATIRKIAAVYVPYWRFAAVTHTYWTADTREVPPGARADWYPVTGEHRGTYHGLLVGASRVLAAAETDAICPFHLDQCVPVEQVDLERVTVEQLTVSRKFARPMARQGLEEAEAAACASQYLNRSGYRNLKVNVRIHKLSSEPILLPVWILAYAYREQVYRILINGQTGKLAGQAPFSWAKLLVVTLTIVAAILILLGGLALIS